LTAPIALLFIDLPAGAPGGSAGRVARLRRQRLPMKGFDMSDESGNET